MTITWANVDQVLYNIQSSLAYNVFNFSIDMLYVHEIHKLQSKPAIWNLILDMLLPGKYFFTQ